MEGILVCEHLRADLNFEVVKSLEVFLAKFPSQAKCESHLTQVVSYVLDSSRMNYEFSKSTAIVFLKASSAINVHHLYVEKFNLTPIVEFGLLEYRRF